MVMAPRAMVSSMLGQFWKAAGERVRGGLFVYAASCFGSFRLATTFQGNNSSMRLIG
jgi:hypothetical protein